MASDSHASRTTHRLADRPPTEIVARHGREGGKDLISLVLRLRLVRGNSKLRPSSKCILPASLASDVHTLPSRLFS